MPDFKFETGNIVTLKKPHPCGSRDFEILRTGADFRLKCCGCAHQFMAQRSMVEKNARSLRKMTEVSTKTTSSQG